SVSTWSIGEINTCPLNTGRWSRKAINRSVRATTLAGSSPRLILQMTSSLTRPILGAGSAGCLEPCPPVRPRNRECRCSVGRRCGYSPYRTRGAPMSDTLARTEAKIPHAASPSFQASKQLADHLQQLHVDLIDLHLVGTHAPWHVVGW